MSRSAKRPVRCAFILLGGLAFVAAAWLGLSQILRADAFARFGNATPSGAEVGVTLGDVKFKGYEKGRLSASASANSIEVRRDRSLFELEGVREGQLFDKDGTKIDFDMHDAQYEYFRNRLTAV